MKVSSIIESNPHVWLMKVSLKDSKQPHFSHSATVFVKGNIFFGGVLSLFSSRTTLQQVNR